MITNRYRTNKQPDELNACAVSDYLYFLTEDHIWLPVVNSVFVSNTIFPQVLCSHDTKGRLHSENYFFPTLNFRHPVSFWVSRFYHICFSFLVPEVFRTRILQLQKEKCCASPTQMCNCLSISANSAPGIQPSMDRKYQRNLHLYECGQTFISSHSLNNTVQLTQGII